MRTASSTSLRMCSKKLRINLLEADTGVGLFCWLLRMENVQIWVRFCLLKIFLNELLTAVKICCWSELIRDDLRHSPVLWFSGVVKPCCANGSEFCPWEVPDWHVGHQLLKGVFMEKPLGMMPWDLHIMWKVTRLRVLASWIFRRFNFLKEGYIPGSYRLYKLILKGSDDGV
jgi:hypothetical protein